MSDDAPAGMERRMVHRLLQHWRDAQDEDAIPTLDDLTERDLDEDILDHLFLLEVPEEGDAIILEIGSALARELGDTMADKPVSAIPDGTLLKQGLSFHARVIHKTVPITLGGEFTNRDGKEVLYRSIIVPLSDDREDIDHLFGAVNGKVKDEAG